MRSVKDRAIILRREPAGEADLILTIYCQRLGKQRVIAKGARRITSRLAGFTELFTVISCHLTFSRHLPFISQVSHDRLFEGIAANRELYQRLHLIAELVDRGCREHQVHHGLFSCLEEGIVVLVQTNHPLVLPALLLRLAELFGFRPEIALCAHCHEAIPAQAPLVWSHRYGGVVGCPAAGVDEVPLTEDEVRVLRFLQQAPSATVARLGVAPQLADRLEEITVGYGQHVLEQEFLSSRALERIGDELDRD